MSLKPVLAVLFGMWVLFTFSACDLIRSLRQESAAIDEEAERDREGSEEVARDYRPRTLRGLSANNVAEYGSPRARSYGKRLAAKGAEALDAAEDDGENGYRRATRADFVDAAAQENSLWDGQGQSNYLFANNRRREPGDMVTADVEKDLRREIQYQLWMTLPPEQRKVKRAPAASASDALKSAAGANAKDDTGKALDKVAEKSQENKAKDAAEEAAKTNMAPTQEDDVIRMEVVENLGNGLVRVLGQKRVIYRGVTRVVEVAGLVSNKDIDDGNRVKSSNFLDMKAQVIQ
jgi:flagellar basal body L-ring protein FlgH